MEIKNREEFLKIVSDCRKHGIEYVKFADFELRLRPESPPSNYKKKKEEEVSELIPTLNQYSGEDALFWSSAGLSDEMRAV